MPIPGKVTGGGNENAANVFRITFSKALSSAPRYEAWDNSQTYPAVDAAGSTTAKEVFAGTAGNSNKPMISLVDTTNAAPGASWKPASATAGSANPNRLLGTTNYVTSPVVVASGASVKFNICGEFPHDATVPSVSSMNHLLQIRYTYTGDAPVLTFEFNSGTEGSPVWEAFTPGTHGVRHTNDGASVDNYKLTLPSAGTVDTGEIWVTAS